MAGRVALCRVVLPGLLLLLAIHGRAAALTLDLPVACTPGEDCFIANYVDLDLSPEAADYACGLLTYDGHKGTDFALPDEPARAAGVDVLAAAPGTVVAIRDSMPDTGPEQTAEAFAGRECGNGVLIDHGDGFETQYCHLQRGSIGVGPGDPVARGDVLGQIGLSGNTMFPHVHFAVRKDGHTVDPFVGTQGREGRCGRGYIPLWSEAATDLLGYRPSWLAFAGFATAAPTAEAARAGAFTDTHFEAASDALVVFADFYGMRADDRVRFILRSPDDRVLVDHTETLPKAKARWFAFAGTKRPQTGWPDGRYTGSILVVRNGTAVDALTRRIDITRD